MKYKISAPHPSDHFIHIEFVVDGIDQDEMLFQLPSWRPGRYELGNFAKNVREWKAENEKGESLTFRKITKDCWKVNTEGAKEVRVYYSYYAAQADAGSCWLDEEMLYINPVHCCLYVPEKMQEECTVEFSLPESYEVATSLKKVTHHSFNAKDYHELVDSPLIASPSLQHHTYDVEKNTFHIWIQGDCKPDRVKMINDFRHFTQEQIRMMGDIPTNDYHFLVLALPYPFHHGVEHLHSTVLAFGPGNELMKEDYYVDFIGVASHELFHVWNIKTIRPHEMMPYNYTKENYSRLGFVYEGVTTYYGDLFLARCGVYTVDQFLNEISQRIQRHFDNYGRFNLSVADSSFDTWLDGYVKGIPSRKVSIYDEGCLIALMTDLMIRRKTNNEKSLDDVMRTLYHDFGKKNIGYTETDYMSIIENLTNEGAADFFIDHVYGTDDYEPILTDLLHHFGCKIVKTDSYQLNETHFGFKILDENKVVKVTGIAPDSPAYKAGLGAGDEIVVVNETKVENNLNELLKYFSDQRVLLKVITPMKKLKTVTLEKSTEKYFPVYRLKRDDNPSTSQQKFFSEWLKSSVRQTYSYMN